MATFVLRKAVASDKDAIASIWHESASLPGVGPPTMPSPADLRRRVEDEFAGWSVTLAVRDAEILGFLALKPEAAILAELFVRPGALGAGIGSALLAHAKAEMPEGFSLFTSSSNTRARNFYEKAGLVILRHDTHPRSGHPVTYYGWRSA